MPLCERVFVYLSFVSTNRKWCWAYIVDCSDIIYEQFELEMNNLKKHGPQFWIAYNMFEIKKSLQCIKLLQYSILGKTILKLHVVIWTYSWKCKINRAISVYESVPLYFNATDVLLSQNKLKPRSHLFTKCIYKHD